MRYLIALTIVLALVGTADAVTLTQLTTTHGMMADWSPDGNTIVYVKSDDIWTIPATGGAPTRLTTYSGVDGYGPKYSPDGSKVLYSTTMDSSGLGTWSIPSGGGSPTKVYDSGANDFRASWSPNGSQIAYRSETPGQTLWVVNSDGTGNGRIQLTSAGYSHPIWHPDGSIVIFHSLSSGATLSDLWTIPPTGGTPVNLTNTPGWSEIDPSYSPDGSWITFVSGRGGREGLWFMPSGGGAQTLIVDYATAHVWGPRWSPDSSMIVFDVEYPGDGYRELWIASDLPYPIGPELPTVTTSGVLTSNETWKNTVNVMGDVTVPDGITLTIEPGTIVRFAARSDQQSNGESPVLTEFIIHGTLIARGTADRMITFTSELAVNPVPGDWLGILFRDPNANTNLRDTELDDSILDHCVIEYAGTSIFCSNYSPRIINSVIRNNSRNGIHCLNSTAIISGNTIVDNHNAGIYLIMSMPMIDGNIISGNKTGIYMHACGAIPVWSITNNVITDNSPSGGIYISNSQPSLGNVSNIDTTDDGGNQIYGNAEYDVWNRQEFTIKAEGNYWGTDDPVVIDSHIVDDDEGVSTNVDGRTINPGMVDFDPWLSSPPDDVSLKPTLSITSVKTPPGTSVTVAVSITDATGVAGGDILVKYDASIVTINDVRGTDLISGITLIANDTTPGKIMLSMAGAEGISIGSGAMVEIDLTVSADAQTGTKTTLYFSDAAVYDELGAIIPVNLENGTIEITGIKGDVNLDGLVRSNDAIIVLRFASGLMMPTEYQKWAADMNEDGEVKSNDAILILRVSSGLAAPGLPMVGGHINIALAESHGVAGGIGIPVVIDGTRLFGGDILISYDISSLRAIEVAAYADGIMACNTSIPGVVRISFAGAVRDGTIAIVNFDVLSDDYPQPVLQKVELYDRDARPIDVRIVRTPVPDSTAVFQNYPNPFNPETWIPYQLAEDSEVTVRIYSSTGQLVRAMNLGYRQAGTYMTRDMAAHWDGTTDTGERVSSGVYFYAIQAGGYAATRKMTVSQ